MRDDDDDDDVDDVDDDDVDAVKLFWNKQYCHYSRFSSNPCYSHLVNVQGLKVCSRNLESRQKESIVS